MDSSLLYEQTDARRSLQYFFQLRDQIGALADAVESTTNTIDTVFGEPMIGVSQDHFDWVAAHPS